MPFSSAITLLPQAQIHDKRVTIIDYGQGNVQSIVNIIRLCGHKAIVTCDSQEISKATHIVLPGVGSFDRAIDNINRLDIYDALFDSAFHRKVPFLGICLGAQIMTLRSEEGCLNGFGWLDAITKQFPKYSESYPSLHIGWSSVSNLTSKLLSSETEKFYFVHSYYMKPRHPSLCSISAEYGITFAAGLEKDNLFAYQFHPEKSHKYGLQLFAKFLSLN